MTVTTRLRGMVESEGISALPIFLILPKLPFASCRSRGCMTNQASRKADYSEVPLYRVLGKCAGR